jgi:hypothetical protein
MPNNFVLLERIELNASAASVTFANIPQSGYTDLKIVVSARGTTSNINDLMKIQFNGSTANFTNRWIQGNSSTASSGNDTTGRIGYMPDAAATASTFGNAEIYIPNYLGSTNKSYSTDAVQENNSSTAGEALLNLFAGLWSQTTAINSITLTGTNGNFAANSTFYLYGLAALGTTPAIAPKASGGNRIDNDGTYWYHTFTSSGAFVPQIGLTADVLVVAGGGGGGAQYGGGGGAGGVCNQTSRSISTGSYSIVIGAGGAGRSGSNGNGSSGVNSTFDTVTANGGGGGGGWNSSVGANGIAGGSGGGGSMGGTASTATTGGAANQSTSGGATGYGFAGANGWRGTTGTSYKAGGGGGAGQVGQALAQDDTRTGSNGGNGLNTWSSWATATSTGSGGYYAGGGGGPSQATTGGIAGLGGLGGGGNGYQNATSTNATNGAANTGSGGGGDLGVQISGAGGSGIIIIRYPIA